jgi:hypothetical protein
MRFKAVPVTGTMKHVPAVIAFLSSGCGLSVTLAPTGLGPGALSDGPLPDLLQGRNLTGAQASRAGYAR